MSKLRKTVMYQFYPFGLLDALNKEHDSRNIKTLIPWAMHLKKLGMNAVYFSPIFESDYHGYDTINFGEIDHRIGNNEDFKEVVKSFHEQDINVILDGVFNHVGRGFWAFQDVLKYREGSYYKDWFLIDFNGNNNYNDGLYYEGWEGHYELVKLNLKNEELVQHILGNVAFWMDYYGIDGLRLDVAYMVDRDFMHRLREFTKEKNPEFMLIGETIHGDYNQIVNDYLLDSCTNYECYKGLYSSFNEKNFFEISFSLNRQFGPENWTLYRGKQLVCFVDNHDVNRIASTLKEKEDLPLIYALLFAMPGIPCIYYGSEWGATGVKGHHSDDDLRPAFEKPIFNELSEVIAQLSHIHSEHKALCEGGYKNLHINNQQLLFERACEDETIYFAINIAHDEVTLPYKLDGQYIDLMTGKEIDGQNIHLKAKDFYFLKRK